MYQWALRFRPASWPHLRIVNLRKSHFCVFYMFCRSAFKWWYILLGYQQSNVEKVSCCKTKLEFYLNYQNARIKAAKKCSVEVYSLLVNLVIRTLKFKMDIEEKMQACSLEPKEELVARIETEKQPTVIYLCTPPKDYVIL